MNDNFKKELLITACKLRMGVIEGVFNAKSGHPGGSLSISDILTYLYFSELNVDINKPKWDDRDRLVMSKGHCAPALYSALALKGFFSYDEIKNLRKPFAMLQGHPDMKGTPGVDMSTGSLGQGISAACGMALSAKISGQDYRVYSIMGDGEIEEGQVWEACMFSAHKNLDNLCIVVDYNGLQIDGKLCDVCSPEPIPDKFSAFGFHVISIDAHDFDQIEAAFKEAKTTKGQPTAIIARSTKGKGISFMENKASWHGSAPNKEQYDIAMDELNKALAKMEGK